MIKYILFILFFWMTLFFVIHHHNNVESMREACYEQHQLGACDLLEEYGYE